MPPVSGRIEPNSATWDAVSTWARHEIASALAALSARGLGPVETEYLRGRLTALRDLVALSEPVQERFVESENDYVLVR